MAISRAFRLLGAVEGGSVTGAQLEVFLADAGRASEFNVLLSMRGQARRMAASPLTMTAIVNSPIAINIVYQQATATRHEPVEAVVESSVAMTSTSESRPSLLILAANPVSWGYFNQSIYYEANLSKVLANYAEVTIVANQSVSDLITTAASMGDIAASLYAMRAVVASSTAVTIMAADATAMSAVSDSNDAIKTVAEEAAIMTIIAGSSIAINEIVTRSYAVAQMAENTAAIQAISVVPASWASYRASAFFAANLKTVIANIAGLTPASHVSVSAMVLDAAALTEIVKSTPAMEALATDSAALAAIAGNTAAATIVINSALAMAALGSSESFLIALLNNSALTSAIFASSIFKDKIMNSTALVDSIGANSGIISYLSASTSTALPASLRSGTTAVDDPFDGIPSKVLVLGMKGNTIVATQVTFSFNGSVVSGTSPGTSDIGLAGTVTATTCTAYTDPTWTVAGIAATIAASPIWIYYDMS